MILNDAGQGVKASAAALIEVSAVVPDKPGDHPEWVSIY